MVIGDLTPSITKGFISYRRDDNTDFDGVVDEIKTKLAALYEAQTGQKIEFFLDRESIGWGEDWRDKIEVSVRQATVFIPIVTLRYFNSSACMDELLAFEASARNLGVTDLLLPIVLFGSDQISDQDDRAEVRLIARLNYKPFEQAWTAGYGSPEWRRAMSDCAKSLAEALSRAENQLSSVELAATSPTATASTAGDEVDDLEGDYDLSTMTARMEEVTEKIHSATAIFEELGEAAGSLGDADMSRLSPGQVNARLLTAARDMAEPSKRLEEAGRDVEGAILEIDPQLREIVAWMSRMSLPEAREQLAGLLSGLPDSGEMSEVEQAISQFIETVQFISLMNVSVRKALRPAVRGLRSFQSALRVFQSWDDLAP